MKNIDLTSLSYEELCELETEIAKKKKDFVSLEDLFIYDGSDEVPHLCYCSRYGSGTNPFYAGYYSKFSDVFSNEYVCEGFSRDEETLLYYLKRNHIAFACRRYSKGELAELWRPIKAKLIAAKLDEEQAELDAKRKRLEYTLNKH